MLQIIFDTVDTSSKPIKPMKESLFKRSTKNIKTKKLDNKPPINPKHFKTPSEVKMQHQKINR